MSCIMVYALVCNFSKPHNSSVVRLNHSDVDTLVHEFGHALHYFLSGTDYQHFSSTKVAFDMAETPSKLFEYYGWDYKVLKKFARHYSTGNSILEKLVESMMGARRMVFCNGIAVTCRIWISHIIFFPSNETLQI
ncbi:unnamed protein product [Lactuca saligna]|uniref:Peptidase M3A/M3B catalytic domain-containing protein n=1 Tax=Lactuca saligna TaxID=75948 RepID=A0AA35Y7C7_LACSI|nr:unnamed protein product [Lactuca saligna]